MESPTSPVNAPAEGLNLRPNLGGDVLRAPRRYDGTLPIAGHREAIVAAVQQNRVTILVADTGSGKSTQVTRFLAEDLAEDLACLLTTVVCTQPRRIAAISLAKYVSSSATVTVESCFGNHHTLLQRSSSRLSAETSPPPKIVYTTDNSLLQAWGEDNSLSLYSHVVIDEAHERSLATDILLGVLKATMHDDQKRRTIPLRIVITSATINPEKFVQFFASSFPTKVIKIPGKTYPVSIRWSDPLDLEEDYVKRTVDKVKDIILKGSEEDDGGGILVFFAEASQAERAQRLLQGDGDGKAGEMVQVYQLHGRILLEDQEKVFQHSSSEKRRQLIFATAVAETSLTVPGISIVVDCGAGKEQRFDPFKSVTSIVLGRISQSSATQRSGRAGRTAPGVCYRLYSKADFDAFEHGAVPEIKRLPLEQCLLRLLGLGIADPMKFDFIDKPQPLALERALCGLHELEAVRYGMAEDASSGCELTRLGCDMSSFSFDPRLSKMLVVCLRESPEILFEVLVICAMVSSGGHIFFRAGTAEEKNRADTKKLRFCHLESDFITMLKVFLEWSVQREEQAKRLWCKENAIHHKSMKSIYARLKEICNTLMFRFRVPPQRLCPVKDPDSEAKLCKIINVCFKQTLAVYSGHADVGYILVKSLDVYPIHPSSIISHSDQDMPAYIVYNHILTTYASFCQHVSCVAEDDPLVEENKERLSSADIMNLKVSQLCYQKVGNKVLRRCFLGEKGILKKALADEVEVTLTKLGQVTFGVERKWPLKIQILPADGQILIWCHERFHPAVRVLLDSKVEAAIASCGFRNYTAALKIPTTSCELIIGQGGTVLEPFLINDFKTVLIKQPPADILQLVSVISEVAPVVRTNQKEDILVLHWPVPSMAKEQLGRLQQALLLECGIGREDVIPCRKNFNSGSKFSLTLQVERRRVKDTIFVNFTDDYDGELFYRDLEDDPLEVDFRLYHAHPARRGRHGNITCYDQLRFMGLGDGVTEEDFEDAIRRRTAAGFTIRRPVEPPFASTQDDLSQLTSVISDEMCRVGNMRPEHFTVRMGQCKNEHKFFLAFVDFSCVETGLAVADRLWRKSRFSRLSGRSTMQIRGPYSRVTSISMNWKFKVEKPEVFAVINVELRTVLGHFTPKYKELERGQGVLIDVKCDLSNVGGLLERFTEAHQLMRGEVIRMPQVIQLSQRLDWDQVRKDMQASLKVFIVKCESPLSPTLTFYGPKDTVNEATDLLLAIWNSTESVAAATDELDLNKPGVSKSEVLRAVQNRFGKDCSGIKRIRGIEDVIISIQKSIMTLTGTKEGIEEVRQSIDKILSNLESKLEEDASNSCTICFTVPSAKDKYVFEMCAHPICRDCLEGQITSGDFPLKCAKEECQALLCYPDLEVILNANGAVMNVFVERSLSHFLGHTGDYANCPVPDCRGLVPKRSGDDADRIFQCQVCGANICTKCQVQWHTGKNCEGVDTDEDLHKWMEEDPDNRKKCPNLNCQAPIEKRDGCNHMTCAKCSTHMCWLCLRTFPDSQSVYSHLEQSCERNQRRINGFGLFI